MGSGGSCERGGRGGKEFNTVYVCGGVWGGRASPEASPLDNLRELTGD